MTKKEKRQLTIITIALSKMIAIIMILAGLLGITADVVFLRPELYSDSKRLELFTDIYMNGGVGSAAWTRYKEVYTDNGIYFFESNYSKDLMARYFNISIEGIENILNDNPDKEYKDIHKNLDSEAGEMLLKTLRNQFGEYKFIQFDESK